MVEKRTQNSIYVISWRKRCTIPAKGACISYIYLLTTFMLTCVLFNSNKKAHTQTHTYINIRPHMHNFILDWNRLLKEEKK